MKDLLLGLLGSPTPLRVVLARKIMRRFSLFSYRDRLVMGAVDRPHYGHCIFEAAKLASRLDYPTISVIEFGCAAGKGLLNAEKHISEIQKIYPVKLELYGFDTGTGLPPPQDYRDFPHYFSPGMYHMDMEAIKKQLTIGKLVLGNVADTCKTFFSDYSPAPIGCIFHDLDFYSSTRDAFTLFEADPTCFLPRVLMYFDDTRGDNTWLVSESTGELLAIEEFNRQHSSKKVSPNRCMPLMYRDQWWWAHQIYVYHDFQHPDYDRFVADDEQVWHKANIGLR